MLTTGLLASSWFFQKGCTVSLSFLPCPLPFFTLLSSLFRSLLEDEMIVLHLEAGDVTASGSESLKVGWGWGDPWFLAEGACCF